MDDCPAHKPMFHATDTYDYATWVPHRSPPFQAVIMCYDITNYDSFQDLDDWYRLVVKTFEKGVMPYVAMVGNKCERQSGLLNNLQ